MLVNMNDVLLPAKKGHYGIGFFNAVNVEMARAIIETAEELRAPVMVGTAEVLLPAMSLERVAEYLIPMAGKASVPVCVHYDHGLTFEKCMEALKLGFTSVMYDCSTEDYESNAAKVAEMVRICHGMGVTVEGELGHVGDNEGAGKLENPSDYYTNPETAADFVKRTGIDSLAVAVGTGIINFRRSWILSALKQSPAAPDFPWFFTEAAACLTRISGQPCRRVYARSIFSRILTKQGRQALKKASPQELLP